MYIYIYTYIHICLQDTGMKKREYRAKLRASLSFVTGWRRPIGYFQLQVIFRKRATNYSALLRKMTCKDKASNDSTPPCAKLLTVMRNISRCVCVVCMCMWRGNRGDLSLLLITKLLIKFCIARNIARNSK